MERDYSIDIFKGLLVIGMVLVHIMQFFSDSMISVAVTHVVNYGNLITFSGFVFCFGYAVSISYLNRSYDKVWRKLLKNTFKTLLAFYISGIAFKLFIGRSPLEYETFKSVFILKDIPGWSEFLASFAYFNFVTLILFIPFKKLINNKLAFWGVFFILLLTSFMPYEKITYNQLGILIGTKNFACFPVLQYMPFYILGMYFEKYKIRFNVKLMLGALVLSAAPMYRLLGEGKLPERFPPEASWITAPMLILYVYFIISKYMAAYAPYLKPIIGLGQNALFSLVMSNVLIFTLKSRFGKLLITAQQSLFMELILLAVIYYLCSIGGVRTIQLGKRQNENITDSIKVNV
jgi:hypothetical protein